MHFFITASQGGPVVSHLFFADDSLFFTQANKENIEVLMHIFGLYEKASGQKINIAKSEIVFSSNVSDMHKALVLDAAGIIEVPKHEVYLGLPTTFGRNKKLTFQKLVERLWNKLKGWKEKSMSSAGKEILIKAVAQALPTYAMSCFLLPEGIIKKMEMLIRRFWWKKGEEDKGINWVAWNKLTKSRDQGGLQFKDLGSFNRALLAKQGWRLIHNPHSLCSRVIKAKYYPDDHFMHAKVGSRPSYAWREIMKGRKVLEIGVRWKIGDGRTIKAQDKRYIVGSG